MAEVKTIDPALLPDGNCVICGAHLGRQAYKEQRVIAIAGGGVKVLFCVNHVEPGNPDRKRNTDKVALALIAQTQRQ